MVTKGRRFLLAAGVIGVLLAGAGPAMAQHSGGGGHGGGGGHASGGGGGHAAAGGHFAGGGAHYAPGGHYAVAGAYGRGYSTAYHGGGYVGAYGRPGGYYGHGYSTGAYWGGGYWHGGFWPRAYYGYGFSWFLPILPLAYATYWYGGIPYYYANDVYYTWNPSYEGYVATDPPPVADQSGSAAAGPGDAAPPGAASAPMPSDAAAQGGPGGAGQIFMYPKNGQSPEQQAKDKAECQQWASQQAGQVAQNGSDYQRAMAACVEGRGYSAR
jgi:hypothetical protein